MKFVLFVLTVFSLNAIAQQPTAQTNTMGEPLQDLKTPNQEVIEKHHETGGALKVKKEEAKIEGLNSTPAEKAATEKAIQEAKKKKKK